MPRGRLEFLLLGPLEVRRDGRPLDLGGPKQRAVLALLLAEVPRVVPVDRLIWLLWGEEAPNRATATLQAYVSHLRRVLEPDRPPRAAPEVLLSRPPGYLLAVEADEVDSLRFERLVDDARRHLAAGEARAAEQAALAAIGLWRGDALADIVDLPPGEPVTARLEALRLVAHETRVDALLALGDTSSAIVAGETLVAARPLHERFSAQLMVALYRAGRQADALRVLRQVRERLADELGVDPGPELTRLELDILQQAPALDLPPPPRGGPSPQPPSPAAAPDVAPPTAEPPAGLVGRSAELAVVAGLLETLRAGVGGVLLVTGGAGIGKTALTEAAEAAARAKGIVVARGSALDRADPPLFVWGRILTSLLDAADPGDAEEARAAGGEALDDVLPGGRAAAGAAPVAEDGNDGQARRFRRFEAVVAALRRLARHPRLLVLDDLHQADPASLRFLRFALPTLRAEPVLVVATSRDAGPDDDALVETLDALAREPRLVRVALTGLDAGAVGAYLASVAGHPVDEGVAAVAHERTGGNPFFVGELARLLVSERAFEGTGAEQRAAAAAAVPAGARDVVRRRLRRLPDDARAVLAVGAVLGLEVDLDLLRHVSGLGADRLVELVEPAMLSEMVVEVPGRPDRVRFAHALVRDVLLGELSAPRRARLHARVAEALEQHRPGRLGAIAGHWSEAGAVGDPVRALRAAVASADAALGAGAADDELLNRRRAVAAFELLGGTAAERADLLLALGAAAKRALDLPAARRAFEDAAAAARDSGDDARLAEAALGFSGGLWWGWWVDVANPDPPAIALLAEAAARPGVPAAVRPRVLGRLAVERYLEPDAAPATDALSAEALRLAHALGDDITIARALVHRHLATWGPDNAGERRRAATEAAAHSRAAGNTYVETMALHLLLADAQEDNDIPLLDATLARIDALTDGRQPPPARLQLAWVRSMRAIAEGDAAAPAMVEANLELGLRYGDSEARRTYGGQLQQVLRDRGGSHVLLPLYEQGVRAEPASLLWRVGYALLLWENGHAAEARAQWEVLRDDDPRRLPRNLNWLLHVAARAEVCTAVGDAEAAATLAGLLEPYADKMATSYTRTLFGGPVALNLGGLALVLDRPEQADAHLARAVELCRAGRANTYLTRSLLRLAEARRRLGDDAGALAAVDEATALARRLGLTVLVELAGAASG